MKRFRARAKGRAPIMKPYSNLTIILSEKKQKRKVEKNNYGTKSKSSRFKIRNK